MPTFRHFEDIDAWKKARVLVSEVYRYTGNAAVSTDFGHCDQIQPPAISTMSNIAEGFGRQSDKEFAHFLNASKASPSEVSSML